MDLAEMRYLGGFGGVRVGLSVFVAINGFGVEARAFGMKAPPVAGDLLAGIVVDPDMIGTSPGATPSMRDHVAALRELRGGVGDRWRVVMLELRDSRGDHLVSFAIRAKHAEFVETRLDRALGYTGAETDQRRGFIAEDSRAFAALLGSSRPGPAPASTLAERRRERMLRQPVELRLGPESLTMRADYLGGHPGCSRLVRGTTVALKRARITVEKPGRISLAVEPDALEGLSLGDHDRMKTLIRTAGGAAFGALAGSMLSAPDGPFDPSLEGALIGAVIGSISGSRNQYIVAAVRLEDGQRANLAFTAEPAEARRFIEQVQAQRHLAYLPRCLEVDDLLSVESAELQRRQVQLLEQLAGHAPSRLPGGAGVADEIERLAGLFERGLLTADEFAAAKAAALKPG